MGFVLPRVLTWTKAQIRVHILYVFLYIHVLLICGVWGHLSTLCASVWVDWFNACAHTA